MNSGFAGYAVPHPVRMPGGIPGEIHIPAPLMSGSKNRRIFKSGLKSPDKARPLKVIFNGLLSGQAV